MIGTCRMIAIEGAHGTGKTTLAMAVTAMLKSRGVHAGFVGDVARDNFVVEASLRHDRPWDLVTHLNLVGAQLSSEQRVATEYHVAVCDRTVLSWLTYATFVNLEPDTAEERKVARALDELCRAYVHVYDAVFLLSDFRYTPHDSLRPRSRDFQESTQELVIKLAKASNVNLIALPIGLSLEEQIACVADHTAPLLGLPQATAV